MTIDAFARAENVIRQLTDRLQGERPLSLIQASRPVSDPRTSHRNMEKRQPHRGACQPAPAVRVALQRNAPESVQPHLPSSLPTMPTGRGWFKRIEVASVIEEDNQNQPFLRLDEITIQSKKPAARLGVHKLMKSGAITETVLTIKGDDDLEKKNQACRLPGLRRRGNQLRGPSLFASPTNVELRIGQAVGVEQEALFEAQLRYTIEEHFSQTGRASGTNGSRSCPCSSSTRLTTTSQRTGSYGNCSTVHSTN